MKYYTIKYVIHTFNIMHNQQNVIYNLGTITTYQYIYIAHSIVKCANKEDK